MPTVRGDDSSSVAVKLHMIGCVSSRACVGRLHGMVQRRQQATWILFHFLGNARKLCITVMRRRIVLHDLRNAVSPGGDHLTAARRFELHFVMLRPLTVVQQAERRNDLLVVVGTGKMVLDRSVMCSCADTQAIWSRLKCDRKAGALVGMFNARRITV